MINRRSFLGTLGASAAVLGAGLPAHGSSGSHSAWLPHTEGWLPGDPRLSDILSGEIVQNQLTACCTHLATPQVRLEVHPMGSAVQGVAVEAESHVLLGPDTLPTSCALPVRGGAVHFSVGEGAKAERVALSAMGVHLVTAGQTQLLAFVCPV